MQRRGENAFLKRFQQNDALAPRKDSPAQGNELLLFQAVANDREGFLCHPPVGHQIVGRIAIPDIHFLGFRKGVDVDGVSGFQWNFLELLVLDEDVLVFGDLVALHLFIRLDDIARFGIDVLPLHPMARRAVESMKARAVG